MTPRKMTETEEFFWHSLPGIASEHGINHMSASSRKKYHFFETGRKEHFASFIEALRKTGIAHPINENGAVDYENPSNTVIYLHGKDENQEATHNIFLTLEQYKPGYSRLAKKYRAKGKRREVKYNISAHITRVG
ncbi:MAG: hypothetical protein V1834_00895 [Candidatus Micrarchaeota archaeon]